MSQRIKKHFTGITAVVFIFLFAYTAFSKSRDMVGFIYIINRHPLLSGFADFAGWMVIALEWLAVLLLLIPAWRYIGFWLTALLMAGFTFYILTMLGLSEKLPCACGGIIRELSWHSHLVLNIFLTALAVAAIMFERDSRRQLSSQMT